MRPDRFAARFWSKVDKSGECWNWTGAKHRLGYGRSGDHFAHRVAWRITHGEIPPAMEIDHICHNRVCVNPEHLRMATRKQNMENHTGPRVNCKSGVRGVSMHISGKWRPEVRHDGKRYNCGLFSDLKEAEAAVIELRNRLHSFNDIDRSANDLGAPA